MAQRPFLDPRPPEGGTNSSGFMSSQSFVDCVNRTNVQFPGAQPAVEQSFDAAALQHQQLQHQPWSMQQDHAQHLQQQQQPHVQQSPMQQYQAQQVQQLRPQQQQQLQQQLQQQQQLHGQQQQQRQYQQPTEQYQQATNQLAELSQVASALPASCTGTASNGFNVAGQHYTLSGIGAAFGQDNVGTAMEDGMDSSDKGYSSGPMATLATIAGDVELEPMSMQSSGPQGQLPNNTTPTGILPLGGSASCNNGGGVNGAPFQPYAQTNGNGSMAFNTTTNTSDLCTTHNQGPQTVHAVKAAAFSCSSSSDNINNTSSGSGASDADTALPNVNQIDRRLLVSQTGLYQGGGSSLNVGTVPVANHLIKPAHAVMPGSNTSISVHPVPNSQGNFRPPNELDTAFINSQPPGRNNASMVHAAVSKSHTGMVPTNETAASLPINNQSSMASQQQQQQHQQEQLQHQQQQQYQYQQLRQQQKWNSHGAGLHECPILSDNDIEDLLGCMTPDSGEARHMASSGQCGPHITTPSLPAGNDDGIHPFPAMEFNPTEVPRSAPMAAASVAAAASAVSPPHGHSVEEVQADDMAASKATPSTQSDNKVTEMMARLLQVLKKNEELEKALKLKEEEAEHHRVAALETTRLAEENARLAEHNRHLAEQKHVAEQARHDLQQAVNRNKAKPGLLDATRSKSRPRRARSSSRPSVEPTEREESKKKLNELLLHGMGHPNQRPLLSAPVPTTTQAEAMSAEATQTSAGVRSFIGRIIKPEEIEHVTLTPGKERFNRQFHVKAHFNRFIPDCASQCHTLYFQLTSTRRTVRSQAAEFSRHTHILTALVPSIPKDGIGCNEEVFEVTLVCQMGRKSCPAIGQITLTALEQRAGPGSKSSVPTRDPNTATSGSGTRGSSAPAGASNASSCYRALPGGMQAGISHCNMAIATGADINVSNHGGADSNDGSSSSDCDPTCHQCVATVPFMMSVQGGITSSSSSTETDLDDNVCRVTVGDAVSQTCGVQASAKELTQHCIPDNYKVLGTVEQITHLFQALINEEDCTVASSKKDDAKEESTLQNASQLEDSTQSASSSASQSILDSCSQSLCTTSNLEYCYLPVSRTKSSLDDITSSQDHSEQPDNENRRRAGEGSTAASYNPFQPSDQGPGYPIIVFSSIDPVPVVIPVHGGMTSSSSSAETDSDDNVCRVPDGDAARKPCGVQASGKGIVLLGGTGRGKSTIINMLISCACSRVSAISCPGSLKTVLFALQRCRTIAGAPCYRVHITHQKSEFSITTLCVSCYAIM
ncbi:uncharacterized protein LOC135820820 isoform X2 [Sycon ciliatum]|uniref:uncharacterized protein LOC135820820 isoform X2 n=1 Tax=Sycon ciliatum TaxID=27933 RepID=UPI0031F68EA1